MWGSVHGGLKNSLRLDLWLSFIFRVQNHPLCTESRYFSLPGLAGDASHAGCL